MGAANGRTYLSYAGRRLKREMRSCVLARCVTASGGPVERIKYGKLDSNMKSSDLGAERIL